MIMAPKVRKDKLCKGLDDGPCYTCARWSARSKNLLHSFHLGDPGTWNKKCEHHIATVVDVDARRATQPPRFDEIRPQLLDSA